jgi:hypothetical protein
MTTILRPANVAARAARAAAEAPDAGRNFAALGAPVQSFSPAFGAL